MAWDKFDTVALESKFRSSVQREIGRFIALLLGVVLCGCGGGVKISSWPPQLDQAYPDLELTNYDGKKFRISDFRGKVVLIEPIGMNCPECNAIAGGNKPGNSGFGGTIPERGVPSMEEMLAMRGIGISIDAPDLIKIHLLLFNMDMKSPTLKDAQDWAIHFHTGVHPNTYVAIGDNSLLGSGLYQATYDLIPGFQLVDRKGILRSDASGHNPKNGIKHLLSKLKEDL